MLIIGTHFFVWGSGLFDTLLRCGRCGTIAQFIRKQGMRFLTVFFVIPVLPVSGVKELAQCPTCGTKYQLQG